MASQRNPDGVSSSDIRQKYDPAKDRALVIQLLLESTPSDKGGGRVVGHDISGLECLAIVVRRIYASLVAQQDPLRLQQYRHMEKGCMLLEYAWQNFDEEDGVEVSLAGVKSLVMEQFKSMGPGSAFQDLVDSPLMKNTIWARNEFLLYCAVLSRSETGWNPKEWELPDAAAASVLCYDGTEHLQDFIDGHFCLWQREDEGAPDELWFSNRPTFVRMMYKPTVPREFSELRGFTMPIAEFAEDPETGFSYDPEADRQQYSLVAAVRLRGDGRRDYVRTYEENGSYIKLPCPTTRYWNGDWRVTDPNTEYFFLFQSCDDAPYPEWAEFELDEHSSCEWLFDMLETAPENQVPVKPRDPRKLPDGPSGRPERSRRPGVAEGQHQPRGLPTQRLFSEPLVGKRQHDASRGVETHVEAGPSAVAQTPARIPPIPASLFQHWNQTGQGDRSTEPAEAPRPGAGQSHQRDPRRPRQAKRPRIEGVNSIPLQNPRAFGGRGDSSGRPQGN